MRLYVSVLTLLLALPVAAQEPDTTDWHAYLPLAVGNEWQYYTSDGVPPYYSAVTVLGESIVDGEVYFAVRRCTRVFDNEPDCDEEPALIRYEENFATIVERRLIDGEPSLVLWYGLGSAFMYSCRLDLPFGSIASADCFDGGPPPQGVGGEYGVSEDIGGDPTPAGTYKVFGTGFQEIYFLSGIGLLVAHHEFYGPEIVYARVDGVEYGNQAIVLAAEDEASPSEPALAVSPNPIRDAATIQFHLAAPERLSLGVYDVRGRHVRILDLGSKPAGEGAVRFDAEDLSPGAYRLHLLGDRGFDATRGVIILR